MSKTKRRPRRQSLWRFLFGDRRFDGVNYAHAEVTPEALHLRVIDAASGEDVHDVEEVDCVEGWAVVWDNRGGIYARKLIRGKFRLERMDAQSGTATTRALVCLAGFAACCGGLIGIGAWAAFWLMVGGMVFGIGAACALVDDGTARRRTHR